MPQPELLCVLTNVTFFSKHNTGIGETEWLYACRFNLPEDVDVFKVGGNADLVFEGLDTFCDVYLVCTLYTLQYEVPFICNRA